MQGIRSCHTGKAGTEDGMVCTGFISLAKDGNLFVPKNVAMREIYRKVSVMSQMQGFPYAHG
jgi:hypothetical protein